MIIVVVFVCPWQEAEKARLAAEAEEKRREIEEARKKREEEEAQRLKEQKEWVLWKSQIWTPIAK